MPIGIYPRTKEHIKNWLKSRKNYKVSAETRKKLSNIHKGHHRGGWKQPKEANIARRNALKGRKTSKGMLGKHHTEESKNKIRLATTRQMSNLEVRKKLSKERKGSKGSNWQGGKSSENSKFRRSLEYRLWRTLVFTRDLYKCQNCGLKGGWNKLLKKKIILNADHIKPFAYYPKLRLEINNGRTLCEDCHFSTETFGAKALRFRVITFKRY